MDSAIQQCVEAGLSSQLFEALKSASIFHRYELFMRLAPWKRHSATLTLKKIYASLTVCVSHPTVCLELNQRIYRRLEFSALLNPTLTQD